MYLSLHKKYQLFKHLKKISIVELISNLLMSKKIIKEIMSRFRHKNINLIKNKFIHAFLFTVFFVTLSRHIKHLKLLI